MNAPPKFSKKPEMRQLVNMRFCRDDEIEADRLGVFFMSEAGYDPRGMFELMQILQKRSRGKRPIEFFSTHPSPDNRVERIYGATREKQAA